MVAVGDVLGKFSSLKAAEKEAARLGYAAVLARPYTQKELDFAILSNWQEHPKLNYELLCHEEILLVLPVGHPLAQKAVTKKECRYPWLDLSLFADTPFILHFPDQNTGRSAQRLFDQYGIQPPVPYLQEIIKPAYSLHHRTLV